MCWNFENYKKNKLRGIILNTAEKHLLLCFNGHVMYSPDKCGPFGPYKTILSWKVHHGNTVVCFITFNYI